MLLAVQLVYTAARSENGFGNRSPSVMLDTITGLPVARQIL